VRQLPFWFERAENLAVAVVVIVVFVQLQFSWWWLPALFLPFDGSAAGYLVNERIGAVCYNSWAKSFLLLALCAVFTALIILGSGVAASREQRRSHGQSPPRPGLGGHAPDGEQHGGTGHDPGLPGLRTDQTRADPRRPAD
jgi:Domain of unknown function (DUF4260)